MCRTDKEAPMTCHFPAKAFQNPAPAPAPPRAGFVRRWWRAYWDRRARKATILILRALDRRTLADIGIDPSEIESLVQGHACDRRRRYDAAWPWRGA
jgi:uncharacterized protein YjiS (DUF1127 family)